MPQKHVMVAVPAYAGTVYLPTMRALMTDFLALAKRGDAVTLRDDVGCTMIEDLRAETMAAFLDSNCTHLIMVDHDVVWPAGALLRMVDHPVDLVGGIYPQRRDPVTFSVRTIADGAYPVDPETGLVEVMGVHGGFMRLTRSCAQKMWDAYKETLLIERNGKEFVGCFEPYHIGRRKLGEDYAFCQRWLDLGEKCWVDPGFDMGHIGLKMWHGRFGEFVPAVKEAAE